MGKRLDLEGTEAFMTFDIDEIYAAFILTTYYNFFKLFFFLICDSVFKFAKGPHI